MLFYEKRFEALIGSRGGDAWVVEWAGFTSASSRPNGLHNASVLHTNDAVCTLPHL